MARHIPRWAALYAVPGTLAILACVVYTAAHAPFATPVNAADLFDGGSDQARITSAVARDKPSVVALDVYVNGTRYVPTDPFGGTAPQTVEGRASGSGFVYDTNGTIVTNAHVISPPSGGNVEKIDVVFANGDHVPGRVTAVNRDADLALVTVDHYAKLPPALPLGDAKTLKAGQWAIAIGEPLELRQTVTVGVVSGFDRSEPIGDENGGRHVFRGLLQTSAPINPGNSGGPLIDMNGRVIGINQSVAGGAQGIGFAIPVDVIRTDVAAMRTNPTTDAAPAAAAFVGIQLAPLESLRAQLGYAGTNGVAVQAVTSGGPADASGIAPGDVIQQIDGQAVNSPEAAADAIHGHQPGQTVTIQIWRNGSQQSVAVRATNAPQVGMAPSTQAPPAQDGGTAPSDGDEPQTNGNSSDGNSQ